MEFKALKVFDAVVRAGGFTRAAAALHLTQPAISKTIRALEDELGTPLLVREGRQVRLTDAGQVVFEQGQRVLAAGERLHEELDALGSLMRGQLTIGLPPMVGSAFFAPVLGSFSASHPGIELVLTEKGARDLERGIMAGELELGVTVLPQATDGLDTLAFSSEDIYLLAPADSAWASRTEVGIEDLREEALILFNEGFALAERIDEACRNAGFRPRVAARSGQWDFIAELVGARLGLALLPRRLCERLDPARFLWRPLLRPRIPWHLAIIWRRDAYLSHAARAFLTLTQEMLVPGGAG